jgi:hypothetical protein
MYQGVNLTPPQEKTKIATNNMGLGLLGDGL